MKKYLIQMVASLCRFAVIRLFRWLQNIRTQFTGDRSGFTIASQLIIRLGLKIRTIPSAVAFLPKLISLSSGFV